MRELWKRILLFSVVLAVAVSLTGCRRRIVSSNGEIVLPLKQEVPHLTATLPSEEESKDSEEQKPDSDTPAEPDSAPDASTESEEIPPVVKDTEKPETTTEEAGIVTASPEGEPATDGTAHPDLGDGAKNKSAGDHPRQKKPAKKPQKKKKKKRSGKKSDQTQKPEQPKTPDKEDPPAEPEQPAEPEHPSILVALDPNGGSCGTSSLTVIPGEPYGNLPTPVFSGYSFLGWFTDPVGGDLAQDNTKVSIEQDHTLYAHWVPSIAHTVSFDPNGGRIKSRDASRSIFAGEVYGTLPVPMRQGYDFEGWFTDPAGGEQIFEESVFANETDQVLFAHWFYDAYKYWTFALKNTTERMYSCQEVSVYIEFDTDNVTASRCALLTDCRAGNAAANRGEDTTVTDEWVGEKNPGVIVKCISDISRAGEVLNALSGRFPDRRILIVPMAAVTGSDRERLYYTLYLGKVLYPDWYEDVDLAQASAELEVSGVIYE